MYDKDLLVMKLQKKKKKKSGERDAPQISEASEASALVRKQF